MSERVIKQAGESATEARIRAKRAAQGRVITAADLVAPDGQPWWWAKDVQVVADDAPAWQAFQVAVEEALADKIARGELAP